MDEILLTIGHGVAGPKQLTSELMNIEPKLHVVVPGVYLADHDLAGRRAQTAAKPLLQRLRIQHLIGSCTAGRTSWPAWAGMLPQGDTRVGFPSGFDRYVVFFKDTADHVMATLTAHKLSPKRLLNQAVLVSPPSDVEALQFPDQLAQMLSAAAITYGFVRLRNYSAPSGL